MIQDVFKVYMNRLMDLSAKNRSIYLSRVINSQMIDLKDLEFLEHNNAFDYIQELLGRKKKIPLVKIADARDKNTNQISRRLKQISQYAKLTEEESGEKSLFVAWPFVEGKLPNDQVIRCPLLFFPVKLIQEGNYWCLQKKSGDQPFINKSFLLAYAHAHEIGFKKEWWENAIENFPKDPRSFLTELYHYLKKELTLNFNQDLFEGKLDVLGESSPNESERDFKTGLLKLKPNAVLGQFSQKSSFLIRDYEELSEKYTSENLEALFMDWFVQDEEQTLSLKEGNLFNTFPMDASQEEVLKTVREGGSCVVQGPPGTGKSQLICNLVTDFISRGKKVLVVSQKRAALEVVNSRLAQQGFSAFLALVHDFRADRNRLFKKISDQIQSLERYKELNRSLDAIQLERNFSQTVRTIETHSEFLEDYRHALFNTEECGVPIKELYISSSFQEEHFNLTQYYKNYHWNSLDEFLRDFKEYFYYQPRYESPDSFWLHRVDFAQFTPNVIHRFKENLEEIKELKKTAENILGNLLYQPFEFPLVYQSFEHRNRLEELQEIVSNEEIFLTLKKLMNYPKGDLDRLWLENKVDVVKKLLSEEGIEWTVNDKYVETVYEKVLHVLQMKESWWKSISLIFYRKEYKGVWELLKRNGLNRDKEGLNLLVKMLENRLNLNHQYTLLNRKEWVEMPNKPFDFTSFNHQSHILKEALKAKFILEDLGMLSPYLVFEKVDFDQYRLVLQELIGINGLIEMKTSQWKNYFSTIQIKHLLTASNDEKLEMVRRTITQDFSEIVALDRLKRKLRTVDVEVINKLIDTYPDRSFEEIQEVFLKGLRFSWIEHIEAKYPVLQEVGLQKVKNILEEFTSSVEEKIKISRFIAELRLRENTFKKLEYNRLNNLITYRDLLHQVSKKKRLWTIKKLIEEFETEVFKLVPCWLASPETVSALFPLESRFDLVVFDESSQCFAERGLPAMLRGKQVVVAGDSQQLQPFDLYKVRLETEEEGIELDSNSLLDLASNYFKKYALDGHYRSRNLSLIEFSNRYFYNNKLTMLPEMNSLNETVQAYKWIKVDGIWDKQSNKAEAETVLKEVKGILKDKPAVEIGVITFNYFQMELITEYISQDNSLSSAKIRVKNIENVQGDEFDEVIFSIGYAKNKAGKFTANFGLLSKEGGINRLNVAVTRARNRVVVVSSITSKDFRDKQLLNPGVKMLRDYLAYAEQVAAGGEVEIQESDTAGFESSWYLKDKLLGLYGNHELKNNSISRLMDLELLEKDRYIGAVLTDDNRLFASKTAKEAFVYHPQLLRQKGWNVVFIFSRQYWLDHEDVLETKLLMTNKKE
ncbi:AAA domain-containing protein [Echinicola salinicaeni]|uniref:AAA domain-containing protein n=1 Tax=Echinicola salinicaeni TaxID=2762757 RepID=UPI0016451174|nr:AAA domain-containing protein [Echinicola salinicaeni]